MDKKIESKSNPEATPKSISAGPEKLRAAKEVKKKTADVLQSKDSAESLEGQEGAEAVDGKISESASETKTQAAQAFGAKKNYTADEIEAIRAKLLAAIPTQEEMVRQIRKKLDREEKRLAREMKKLQRKPHLHAFELTIVVAQLRAVREYFFRLAHATYEMIKHLWLKIVHGV